MSVYGCKIERVECGTLISTKPFNNNWGQCFAHFQEVPEFIRDTNRNWNRGDGYRAHFITRDCCGGGNMERRKVQQRIKHTFMRSKFIRNLTDDAIIDVIPATDFFGDRVDQGEYLKSHVVFDPERNADRLISAFRLANTLNYLGVHECDVLQVPVDLYEFIPLAWAAKSAAGMGYSDSYPVMTAITKQDFLDDRYTDDWEDVYFDDFSERYGWEMSTAQLAMILNRSRDDFAELSRSITGSLLWDGYTKDESLENEEFHALGNGESLSVMAPVQSYSTGEGQRINELSVIELARFLKDNCTL